MYQRTRDVIRNVGDNAPTTALWNQRGEIVVEHVSVDQRQPTRRDVSREPLPQLRNQILVELDCHDACPGCKQAVGECAEPWSDLEHRLPRCDRAGRNDGVACPEIDEEALAQAPLREVALWDAVKDNLRQRATSLTLEQQQKLCIARLLPLKPRVILMDEPCSALDPLATLKIEDLMDALSERFTLIIVTHNLQQAARVSHRTAFMLAGDDGVGRLVEYEPTDQLFTNPKDERTESYITGRFG